MLVDYVRVYQRMVNAGEDEKADNNAGVSTNGAKDGLYGDYKIGKGVTPVTPGTTNPSETKPEGTTLQVKQNLKEQQPLQQQRKHRKRLQTKH